MKEGSPICPGKAGNSSTTPTTLHSFPLSVGGARSYAGPRKFPLVCLDLLPSALAKCLTATHRPQPLTHFPLCVGGSRSDAVTQVFSCTSSPLSSPLAKKHLAAIQCPHSSLFPLSVGGPRSDAGPREPPDADVSAPLPVQAAQPASGAPGHPAAQTAP